MSKKVSILIPLYNGENYIEETIDSALNQTHNNIEIIVVDDSSTDDSLAIVEKISSDKVTLVKNKGKGACAARNYAYELSKGDYIQYLDADDLMDKDKLKYQLEQFETQDDESISFGSWARFTSEIQDVKWELMSINKDYVHPINLLVDSWNTDAMVPIHGWLTPSTIINKAGPWNEELHHNQDGEFFTRVIENTTHIKFCKSSKVYYRTNVEHSISNASTSEKNASSQLLSYQLYIKNLRSYMDNIEVKKALANNFLHFIYRFYDKYPTLVKEAENEFHNLEVGKMWAVGGDKFKILAKLVGFKYALKIRKGVN